MTVTKFTEWLYTFGQSKIANELGITRQQVNAWAKDRERPSDSRKVDLVNLSNGELRYQDFFIDEVADE